METKFQYQLDTFTVGRNSAILLQGNTLEGDLHSLGLQPLRDLCDFVARLTARLLNADTSAFTVVDTISIPDDPNSQAPLQIGTKLLTSLGSECDTPRRCQGALQFIHNIVGKTWEPRQPNLELAPSLLTDSDLSAIDAMTIEFLQSYSGSKRATEINAHIGAERISIPPGAYAIPIGITVPAETNSIVGSLEGADRTLRKLRINTKSGSVLMPCEYERLDTKIRAIFSDNKSYCFTTAWTKSAAGRLSQCVTDIDDVVEAEASHKMEVPELNLVAVDLTADRRRTPQVIPAFPVDSESLPSNTPAIPTPLAA